VKIVNIYEAKTHLSKLVEEASKGESFVIAKAGKPVVKVTALSFPTGVEVRDSAACSTTHHGKPLWAAIRSRISDQLHASPNMSASRGRACGTWHATCSIGVRIGRRRVSFSCCGYLRDRLFRSGTRAGGGDGDRDIVVAGVVLHQLIDTAGAADRARH